MSTLWTTAALAYLALGIAAFAFAKYLPRRFGACAEIADYMFTPVVENPLWIFIPLMFWLVWPFVFVAGMLMDAGALETQLRNPGKSGRTHPVDMIGLEGKALTDLKPAGKVSVAGNTFDASCLSAFIPKGTRVKVVRRDPFCLIVQQS